MSIEREIFKKKAPDTAALVKYGFKKQPDGSLACEKEFMGGDFVAAVSVGADGEVTAAVIDAATGEEYLPLRVETAVGSYTGEVRQAYAEILSDVAEKCFVRRGFLYPQTERMALMIEREYGEKPDYPFRTDPEIAVFRCPANRKWYGIVMDIRKSRLAGEDPRDDTVVEVVNLKATGRVDELIGLPGVYPAYHMSRGNWISVLLDGTLGDETLEKLVAASRAFAVSAGGKRPPSDSSRR